MKYIIPLMMMALFYSSCKKDLNACVDYKDVTGRELAVDVTTIAQELSDTLANYPQLVPYQVKSDQYTNSVHCHIYYNNLLVFLDSYTLVKAYSTNTLYVTGKAPKPLPAMSLEPAVKHEDAITVAKKNINFDHSCISYQLGLYDMNRWTSAQPANYRLAWKISDVQKPYIYVITDAVTNQLIISDNGIRFAF